MDEEAELNVFCVTCGIEISPRVALRHMEKCFNKVTNTTISASLTSFITFLLFLFLPGGIEICHVCWFVNMCVHEFVDMYWAKYLVNG